MSEPDEKAGLLVQASACPWVRAAYATGDAAVIRRMEAVHPPSSCAFVKKAAREAETAEAGP